jgi:hypothetical protein
MRRGRPRRRPLRRIRFADQPGAPNVYSVERLVFAAFRAYLYWVHAAHIRSIFMSFLDLNDKHSDESHSNTVVNAVEKPDN